jgi:putative transposase
VEYIVTHYALNTRRACRLVKQTRSVQYYRSVKGPHPDLRVRMRDIAHTRVRYGYRRIHVLLKRDGWRLGKNQMYRLYREEQLQLRSKLPKRRKMVVVRRERIRPRAANEVESGLRVRSARRWDAVSRADRGGCLQSGSAGHQGGQRLGGEHVVAVPNRLVAQRQAPNYLFVDNGSEFSGRLLDLWAYRCKARIDFSRPGKPTDNCYVETFNGSFRDECLNLHWSETIEDARAIIEAWRRDYSETRPHMALNDIAPEEYARQMDAWNAEN